MIHLGSLDIFMFFSASYPLCMLFPLPETLFLHSLCRANSLFSFISWLKHHVYLFILDRGNTSVNKRDAALIPSGLLLVAETLCPHLQMRLGTSMLYSHSVPVFLLHRTLIICNYVCSTFFTLPDRTPVPFEHFCSFTP